MLPGAADFEAAARSGDLLVAEFDGELVGFVQTKQLDGCLHVVQVTVAPTAQRQGIGRRLMIAVEQRAIARGFAKMTLTTFRDVPFNGPFYRRLGWREIDDEELSAGLRAEREEEAAAGLDHWPRVAMAKVLV
ncbi:MAG: GNAT family N-acetyltransferase [Nocardioides sp.]|uniref:GNAT family N-acetyltransferase n=1 Tax=Nocardioides sp. TaxID=35761 RepID=UPI0039E424DC